MKTSGKRIVCGASALLAAALALHAQTSTTSTPGAGTDTRTTPPASSSGSSTVSQPGSSSSSASAREPSASSQSGSAAGSSSGALGSSTSPSSSSSGSTGTTAPGSSSTASGSLSGSASGSASGSVGTSNRYPTEPGTATTGATPSPSGSASAGTTATTDTARTQNTLTATTQADTQVTTFVQQLDAQGPVVIERVSTQFADVACSAENARMLVEALHGGTAVTLSADGKTATFTPTAKLGYGETYIALALAAEALRNAGITGCATPEQWQAVLMGGPLAASGTTTTSTSVSASSSSSSHFPGILALHAQGQGWGQIAQRTNVQLGQIVSSAQSSFKLDKDSSLAPTGRTSAEMEQERKGSADTRGRSDTAPQGKAQGQENKDENKPTDTPRSGGGASTPGTNP